MSRYKKRASLIRSLVLLSLSLGLFGLGILVLWASTWKLPDISSFNERKVTESTKIFDRTGGALLYDLHGGATRTVVPYREISRHMKNATVAIEDDTFWQHRGIRPLAFLRAALVNVQRGTFSQGGSTITQQVVKNSLLTSAKKISRKFKEWVLAYKLEQTFSKEEILALYLNEVPYGGTIYGVEEAARVFFGKSANNLSVAEAAYLAALPNAPTYYSPYGNHRDKLEERKNLVLHRMQELNFITEEEYKNAKKEVFCAPKAAETRSPARTEQETSASPSKENVIRCTSTFKPQADFGILAPHFVMFVRQYLEEKYGREALEEQGLTVITTLDYELQSIAEKIVREYALKNKETFDAENAALVALDPRTGQILAMVGSRDYFDKEIDGNFNVSVAYRQPGSAFKPFVYAQALRKGFTPETVLFDLPTEFSTECAADGTPLIPLNADKCYKPENYDGRYHGPVTLREALAQSINVASIKVFYLAGLRESLRLAKDMGISTLTDIDRYGLTLVLGGGEVKLLELTSAYGVFAAEGVYAEPRGILRVETKDGRVLEEWAENGSPVLEEKIAQEITHILSDNQARAPAFSATSPLYFPGRDVAAKTGTTNDYRDAWIVGYTPSLVVGAWAGNNDNRPMQKKVAAFIVAPLWNAFMQEALKDSDGVAFTKPPEEDRSALPPQLRGIWQGGKTYFVDKLSGKRATEFTPPELREERAIREVHSILYWIDKAVPGAFRTAPPESDPQFSHWEYAVRAWAKERNLTDETEAVIPAQTDDLHTPAFAPKVSAEAPAPGSRFGSRDHLLARVNVTSHFPIGRVNFFVNNSFVGSATKAPWEIRLPLADIDALAQVNELKAVAYDIVQNRGEATVTFLVSD